jgi:hypothetical protein
MMNDIGRRRKRMLRLVSQRERSIFRVIRKSGNRFSEKVLLKQ